ncbi:MAG TPA: hypothetical protein VF240_19095 [Pyrinomonadaceae bacterium]
MELADATGSIRIASDEIAAIGSGDNTGPALAVALDADSAAIANYTSPVKVAAVYADAAIGTGALARYGIARAFYI